MMVIYHPAVQQDVSGTLRYYDAINSSLGDEFWEDLNSFITQAAANPEHFHFEAKDRRRVNLKRFPYHFLFRQIPGGIRITVVRHHHRHPTTGLKRQ